MKQVIIKIKSEATQGLSWNGKNAYNFGESFYVTANDEEIEPEYDNFPYYFEEFFEGDQEVEINLADLGEQDLTFEIPLEDNEEFEDWNLIIYTTEDLRALYESDDEDLLTWEWGIADFVEYKGRRYSLKTTPEIPEGNQIRLTWLD